MPVHDGGMMHTSSCCEGPWHPTQALALRPCLSRRHLLEVAFDVRVSTSRQHQPQPMDHHLPRLRASAATHPEGQVAEAHLEREDGYRGATLKRPGRDRLRARAALAAFEGILITAPARLARNDVPQRLVVAERPQRGWRGECIARPRRNAPHAPWLVPRRSAVAA